jgi:hypothetical protein
MAFSAGEKTSASASSRDVSIHSGREIVPAILSIAVRRESPVPIFGTQSCVSTLSSMMVDLARSSTTMRSPRQSVSSWTVSFLSAHCAWASGSGANSNTIQEEAERRPTEPERPGTAWNPPEERRPWRPDARRKCSRRHPRLGSRR